MRKNKVVLASSILAFVFLSLAYGQSEEKRQEQLTSEVYAQKMANASTEIKRIIDSKFIFDGKEANFVSKKVNTTGNAAAMGFYGGLKQNLEDVKKEILTINPPSEYIENYKLFNEALDYTIAAYGKAVEAHQKDDITIMDEGGVLLGKGGELMLKANQSLEKTKSTN